jgi:hypothetical protein
LPSGPSRPAPPPGPSSVSAAYREVHAVDLDGNGSADLVGPTMDGAVVVHRNLAGLDHDRDGVPTEAEWAAGTDPLDPEDL